MACKEQYFSPNSHSGVGKTYRLARADCSFVLIARGGRRDPRRIVWRRSTAPDHMQIGPHQNEIASIDLSRGGIGNLHHRHGRTTRAKRRLKCACTRVRAAKLEDGVAFADAVLDRRAVIEPDL